MNESSITIDNYKELMKINNPVSRGINVSHQIFILGNTDLINNDDLDLKTVIMLALPFDRSCFKEGNFSIPYKGKVINVQISKILNEAQQAVSKLHLILQLR